MLEMVVVSYKQEDIGHSEWLKYAENIKSILVM